MEDSTKEVQRDRGQNDASRLNRIFAALAFIISAVIYLKTVAPTFSFWDCGEFVACATTLGIAHPPGSPLFILLGRLFAVLPFGSDVGWRINLLSSISFSLSVMFGYLIVERLATALWGAVESAAERLTISFGSLSGALLLGFGLTAWSSAVEAEVYGLTMALYFAIIWLIVIAYQSQSPGRRTRYALLALYLMVLGVGVHMTVALAVVVLIPLFAFKNAQQRDWLLLTVFILVELYLIFALSSLPDEIPLGVPIALVLVGLLFHMFSLEKTPRALFITAGLLALAVYPLLFDIWRQLRGPELPDSIQGLAALPIGWAGIIGGLGWTGYAAFRVFRRGGSARASKNESLWQDGYLTSFYYLATALFLALMTEFVRGYTAFIIVSALLTLALLVAVRSRINWQIALASLASAALILGFWEFVHGVLLVAPIVTALEYIDLREKTKPLSFSAKITIGVIFLGAISALVFSNVLASSPLAATLGLAVVATVSVIWLWLVTRKAQAPSVQSLSAQWKTAILIVVIALIGFSVSLTVPVRSAQSPMIDQNNPSRSVAAFVGYIERKQYGSTSMTKRMFTRRAEWLNQFGVHRRMGFWGFFREQYGVTGWRFPALFVLGVFGLWELFRRNKTLGGIVFISLLAGTVGLILYMNFADGTRMIGGRDYLEVRDRDYFFTTGYMLFGLVIGLGVVALLRLFKDLLTGGRGRASLIMPLLAFTSLSLPALAVAHNYSVESRSGNFIPYDYAKNLLDSAEKNAILITGGDNDTFPLWALQAAYHYRPDVAVLNLSLANTDWYLKQMRDKWHVPLPLSDEQIDGLRYRRMRDGRLSRIQDQIVDMLLLTADKHKRPINFSKTIPPSGRKLRGESIDNRLTAIGRVYKVRSDTGGFVLGLRKTDSLYMNVFSFRGLGKDGAYQDAVSRGMTNAYIADLLEMARIYRNRKSWGDVKRILGKATELFPDNGRIREEYVDALFQNGDSQELRAFIAGKNNSDQRALYKRWTQLARVAGDDSVAFVVLSDAVTKFPGDKELFYGLIALQLERKEYGSVEMKLTEWMKTHQSDTTALSLLNRLRGAAAGIQKPGESK